jgi:NADH-quinone oxidoreductase subunit E
VATTTKEEAELLPELLAYIGEWKDRPGNLIMILHKTQELYGYVPRAVAMALAALLHVPLAKIYGVITFYHYFKLKEPGRNQISVCLGTACYLKAGEDILKEIESLLGVGVNTVTEDGEFSIEAVRCLGCCGLAPVMMVNKQVYGNLTKNRLPEILAAHRGR